MESGNRILDAARHRAQSRASILQSLQQSFQNHPASAGPSKAVAVASKQSRGAEAVPLSTKKRKSTGEVENPAKKSKPEPSPSLAVNSAASINSSIVAHPQKAVVNQSVEAILQLIGDNSDRSREHYRDSLQSGKALIIENAKSQQKANKTLNKLKKRAKQQQRISRREMKAQRITPQFADLRAVCTAEHLAAIHMMWWEYARITVISSKGDNQLQARLQELELVGAKVVIHQSRSPALLGLTAIVIAQSANIYYLVHNRYTGLPAEDQANGKHKITAHYLSAHQMVKVDKRHVTLAIQIPGKHKRRHHKERKDKEEAHAGSSSGESDDEGNEEDAGNSAVPAAACSSSGKNMVDSIGFQEAGGKVMLLYGQYFLANSQSAVSSYVSL